MNDQLLILKSILVQLENGPTILSLAQILDVKIFLQSIDQEIIFNEEEDFLKIMDILVDSFLTSAIFEVNDQNQILFVDFSVWLNELGKVHLFGTHMDDLSAYANVLIQKFAE